MDPPALDRFRGWIARRFEAPRTLRHLGAGDDYWAVLADERWVYRFPQADRVVAQLESEVKVLPRLGHLPLPIPDVRRVGRPDGRDDLERPFLGYPMLRGVAASPTTVPDPEDFVATIGEFLDVLHATPAEPPFTEAVGVVGAPRDPSSAAGHPVGERVLAFLDAIDDGAPAFCHEDLGLNHILVDPATGRITAILDWGDCRFHDPAVDWIGCLTTWPELVARHTPQELRRRTWGWSLRYGLHDCVDGGTEAEWAALEARLRRAERDVG